MKATENFCNAKETIMCYHQIDTFAVSKDGWNTKENTGKSMKDVFIHDTSWAETMSNSGKPKPIASANIELCLSEGISQFLSQSFSQLITRKLLKFCSNFLKAFQVDL